MLFIIFITWYLIGVSSFYFWWTREFEFTKYDIPIAYLSGVLGPIAWINGYSVQGKRTNHNFFGMKK